MKRLDFLSPTAPPTRLGAPTFDAEATETYGAALDALEDAGIGVLVGGALALNRYTSVWRDTKDLDLFLRPADVEEALRVLADAGLETERIYRSWLSKAWRGDAFVDLIHRNASGVHDVDDAWFDRAEFGTVLGRDVAFVPPEELLFSKVFVATRYRFDGADVLHLIYALRGELDWDHLIGRCGREFAGLILSYLHLYRWTYPASAEFVTPDLMDAFEALAREDLERPRIPFRGRLLDITAFEVDVTGWGLPDAHAERMDAVLGPGERDGVPP